MQKTTFHVFLFICVFGANSIAQSNFESFSAVYIPCFAQLSDANSCELSYNENDHLFTCPDGTKVEDCLKCQEIDVSNCKFIDEDLLERVKPPKGKDCIVFKVNGKANKLKALPDLSQFDGSSNPIKECSLEAFFARERITFGPRSKKIIGEKVFYTEKGNKSSAIFFYYPRTTVNQAKIRFSIKSENYQMSMIKGKFDMKTLMHVYQK